VFLEDMEEDLTTDNEESDRTSINRAPKKKNRFQVEPKQEIIGQIIRDWRRSVASAAQTARGEISGKGTEKRVEGVTEHVPESVRPLDRSSCDLKDLPQFPIIPSTIVRVEAIPPDFSISAWRREVTKVSE
jgi:hypothetical protein